MHLLEAANFKKKYAMKKNAIDGMMTNMNDSNFHWAHDAPVGKGIRSKKQYDSNKFNDGGRNNLR